MLSIPRSSYNTNVVFFNNSTRTTTTVELETDEEAIRTVCFLEAKPNVTPSSEKDLNISFGTVALNKLALKEDGVFIRSMKFLFSYCYNANITQYHSHRRK